MHFRGQARKKDSGGRSVQFEEVLQIAYAAKPVSVVAAAHDLSLRTVRRLQYFVAEAFMTAQNRFLGKLLLALKQRRATCAVQRLAFDETGQRLALTLRQHQASAYAACSTWQVMQSTVRLVLGWAGEDSGDSVPEVCTLDLVLPPMIITSSAACHIWAAFRHRLLAPTFTALRLLLAEAQVPVELTEFDAAYANERYHAAQLMADEEQEHSRTLKCAKTCSLHQNQLIEVLLLQTLSKAGDMHLLSRLYSLTLLLQTGGHFLRMLVHLPQVVREGLRVHKGMPPLAARAFFREVVSYAITHHRQFEDLQPHRRTDREADAEAAPRPVFDADAILEQARLWREKPGRKRNERHEGRSAAWWDFMAELLTFMEVFNGCWWESDFQHYCTGPACCRNEEATVQKMRKSLHRVIFKRIPCAPAANKWTKLGPVCDTLIFGLMVHNVYAKAFFALSMPTEPEGGDSVPEALSGGKPPERLDASLEADLCFSKVQGVRFAAARKFLCSPDIKATLLTLSLMLEPLRYLSAYWMRVAGDPEKCGESMFEMLFEPSSPLLHVRQHLASLLFGHHSRLQLVWRQDRRASWEEWCAHHRNRGLRVLRRAVLLVSCCIYRRHVMPLKGMPWRLLLLAADHVPQRQKLEVARAWGAMHLCCCRPGLARDLKQRGITGDSLMREGKHQLALRLLAASVRRFALVGVRSARPFGILLIMLPVRFVLLPCGFRIVSLCVSYCCPVGMGCPLPWNPDLCL